VPQPSTHEDFSRQARLQGSSDRSFGFLWAAFLLLLGLWPLIHRGSARLGALVVGVAFGLIAALHPIWLRPLNVLWTRLGFFLGRIVNPIVLAFLFYLVVTPAAIILRWMGKDLLKLRYESDTPSYWIPRLPPGPPPETMARQF
jgi:hypothetical protein